jgi:hypothetical protein
MLNVFSSEACVSSHKAKAASGVLVCLKLRIFRIERPRQEISYSTLGCMDLTTVSFKLYIGVLGCQRHRRSLCTLVSLP